MKPFSIPKNIHFFENQRSNLSIWASQGELAATPLISKMPSDEGVLIREKAPEAGKKHRAPHRLRGVGGVGERSGRWMRRECGG